MNSKKRTIIISAIVLVLLVGVLVVLKITAPKKDDTANSSAVSSAPVIELISKDIAEFTSIGIKNAKDEYSITKIDDTNYGIESLKKYTQTPTYCLNTVNDFIKLSAQSKVLDKLEEADKAKYGLDEPSAVTAVKFADTEYTVTLGNVSPDKGYYATISGDEGLYTLKTSNGEAMLRNKFYYLDKVLVESFDQNNPEAKPDVTKLSIERKDLEQPILIEKYVGDATDRTYMSSFQMKTPIVSDVDYNADTDYINAFFGIAATDIVAEYDEGDSAKYGFDDPTAKIGFEYDGKVKNFVVGNKIEAEQTAESKVADTATYYNVLLNDNGLVYKVSEEKLIVMEATGDDFISTLGILPNIINISTVDITLDGVDYTFEITNVPDEEDATKVDTTAATCNGKELDIEIFKKYYQLLLTASIEKINTEPVTGTTSAKITYNYIKGGSDTVELYEQDGRRLVVSINGEAKYVGRSQYLEKLRSETAKLLEGKEIDIDL